MIVIGQKGLYSGNLVVFRKVVVFGQSCCIRAKMVVFGQKWLCSGKSCRIRTKWSCSCKCGCVRAKLLYSGKVVVSKQSGCTLVNVVLIGQKWLYSGIVVV